MSNFVKDIYIDWGFYKSIILPKYNYDYKNKHSSVTSLGSHDLSLYRNTKNMRILIRRLAAAHGRE